MKCDSTKTTKITITAPTSESSPTSFTSENQPLNWPLSTSESCGIGTETIGSPQQHVDFDLEDLLLQQPILPPNSNFFCCFQRYHITAVAKALSIIYILFYTFLCILSYKSEHAVAFLISVLVCFSVGASTIYATFKWVKLCIIPFFLLQIMLVLYSVICIALLFYALLSKSYVYYEMHKHFDKFLNLNTRIWILIFLITFILLTIFFCYSSLLFLYEYQFVAEIDQFLKSIKRSSSQNSKDQDQPNITVIGSTNNRLNM